MKNTKPLFKINATGAEILAKANKFQTEFEASRKETNLTLRISMDKKREMQELAAKAGVSVSNLVQLMFFEYKARFSPPVFQIGREAGLKATR